MAINCRRRKFVILSVVLIYRYLRDSFSSSNSPLSDVRLSRSLDNPMIRDMKRYDVYKDNVSVHRRSVDVALCKLHVTRAIYFMEVAASRHGGNFA